LLDSLLQEIIHHGLLHLRTMWRILEKGFRGETLYAEMSAMQRTDVHRLS